MGIAESADVAGQEFPFGAKLLTSRMVGLARLRREEVRLDAVFDDCRFFPKARASAASGAL